MFLKGFNRLSFRSKITFGLGVFLLICGLSVGFAVTKISEKSILEEHYKRGEALLQSIAYRSLEAILSANYLEIQKIITSLKKIKNLSICTFWIKTKTFYSILLVLAFL